MSILMAIITIINLITYHLALEAKEVELYYSSSINETINNIFYIYREFVVITKHYAKTENCSVEIIHEKSDESWVNLPAKNIFYFIKNTIEYDIWQYQIKWLSLGTPFQFNNNFYVKFSHGYSNVYYDNNQYHNYNLKNNEGYYLNKNREVKIIEASLTYDNRTNTTKLDGKVLIKNKEFLKYCFVCMQFLGLDEEIGVKITEGRFLSKNNRYGIEKWEFENTFPVIVTQLAFYAAVFYQPQINHSYIDDNFNRYYFLSVNNTVINHDNNNIAYSIPMSLELLKSIDCTLLEID